MFANLRNRFQGDLGSCRFNRRDGLEITIHSAKDWG